MPYPSNRSLFPWVLLWISLWALGVQSRPLPGKETGIEQSQQEITPLEVRGFSWSRQVKKGKKIVRDCNQPGHYLDEFGDAQQPDYYSLGDPALNKWMTPENCAVSRYTSLLEAAGDDLTTFPPNTRTVRQLGLTPDQSERRAMRVNPPLPDLLGFGSASDAIVILTQGLLNGDSDRIAAFAHALAIIWRQARFRQRRGGGGIIKVPLMTIMIKLESEEGEKGARDAVASMKGSQSAWNMFQYGTDAYSGSLTIPETEAISFLLREKLRYEKNRFEEYMYDKLRIGAIKINPRKAMMIAELEASCGDANNRMNLPDTNL